MSSNVKSAIQAAQDQLFADTADGIHLDVVGSNIGLDRPRAGLSDDKWRALIRKIAFQPKLVMPIFHRILEICIGPKITRCHTLADACPAGETSLYLEDSTPFIQTGTLILDPGLATEEEVDFSFRDLKTHRIYLSSATEFSHEAVAYGSGRVSSALSVGAISVPLVDSSKLPTSGYPYSLVIGKGTDSEEFVSVTNNNTSTNTLTTSALDNAHAGPKSLFVHTKLLNAAPAGRMFVRLEDGVEHLPYSGFIRIGLNTVSVEVCEYVTNQNDGILILKRPLTNSHAVGASVDHVSPGTFVETASVVQVGKDWDVYSTEPRVLKVLLPSDLHEMSARDASWLRGAYTAASTTLAANVLSTDTEMQLASAAGFPAAGRILVNGTTTYSYAGLVKLPIESISGEGPFVLVDGYTLTLQVDGGSTQTATFNTADFADIAAAEPHEVAAVINTDTTGCVASVAGDTVVIRSDTSSGTIRIVGGTGNGILGFPVVVPKLTLSKAAGTTFTLGDTAALSIDVHTSTDLEDGNPRDASGVLVNDRYPGPYLFDETQNTITSVSSTLATEIPSAITVAEAKSAGVTCLEVLDAGFWPTSPSFDVIVGKDTGFAEDTTVLSKALKLTTSTTVVNPSLAGATTIEVTSASGFPASFSPLYSAGYRILVGEGTANEEILTVDTTSTTGTDTITLTVAATNPHAATETVTLLNDVVAFNSSLDEDHAAGHMIEPYVDEIALVSTGSFDESGGEVYFNFGKEILNFRAKITSIPDTDQVELADTTDLPTSGYPYKIIVGEGRPNAEIASVTDNDTANGILTFSVDLVNTHTAGEYVEFSSGTPEVVTYNSVSGNSLVLDPPVTLSDGHIVGERVSVSVLSAPDVEGHSFAFFLPPNFNQHLEDLFDLVRASGTTIEFIVT